MIVEPKAVSKMPVKFFRKGIINEVLYSCIILSTYLFHGISRSYPSFLFHQLDAANSTITVNDEEKSWIAAYINLLSPVGCMSAGIIMDAYGRKLSVQCVFVPFLVSWVMLAFAKNVSMIYMAALIQSIGTGMSFSTSTYISEISTADHRGALLGSVEIIFCLGVLLCNILMYFMNWSIVSMIFIAVTALSLVLTFILPESPTWLYLKGRKDESINTLISIRGQNRDAIKPEIEDMENYTSSQAKTKLSETIKNCFLAWKQFSIAFVLFILQQHTGYSTMTLFIIMIVDRLHIPYASTDVALMYSVASSVAGFITPYVMYKFNRKPTLTISAIGMSICAAAIPIYQSFSESYDEKPFPWVVIVALCTYVISCGIGVLPISFTIAGELFPNEVRGVLNGVYGAVAYLYWSFLYKITPWFLAEFGASGVMWTFSVSALLTALFSVFVLPETKGKTLNEVQEEYFKKKSKNELA
ncbi:facilitated trehalose transporter Tret1-like [Planococcus citri]|uniref:facilitated trehalose transporter Tret1-like n=1 Tax=Planococcus citri TaxID=170843 RepID=UPI0031F96DA2